MDSENSLTGLDCICCRGSVSVKERREAGLQVAQFEVSLNELCCELL